MVALRRVTIRELAARTGYSEFRVGRNLRQRATPTLDELRTLAAALFDDADPVVAL